MNSDEITLSKGTTSSTIKIIKSGPSRFETKSSGRFNYIVFPVLILFFFTGIVLGVHVITGQSVDVGIVDSIKFVLLGVVMGGIIYFFSNMRFKPLVFDFNTYSLYESDEFLADLKEVSAVQLLVYHSGMQGEPKIRFEMNLVKNNNERIFLFNNSKYSLVKKQAQFLAEKLDVEILDQTN